MRSESGGGREELGFNFGLFFFFLALGPHVSCNLTVESRTRKRGRVWNGREKFRGGGKCVGRVQEYPLSSFPENEMNLDRRRRYKDPIQLTETFLPRRD